MTLPKGFQFSQQSLQDYVDCARRFQLRYLLMQPWPALITEPAQEAEAHVRRGADLHRLAHQHTLGLPAERLAASIRDPLLAEWWQTWLSLPPPDLPTTVRRAEAVVSCAFAGYRLLAKYDLVAVDPGSRIVIVDWKTSPKRPTRASLASRLQTMVYLALAVEAGASLDGPGHLAIPAGWQVPAERVEMIYWFAASGGAVERFRYDREQHVRGLDHLARLVSQVAAENRSIWQLTPDVRLCRYCNYRSLCDRGVRAGLLAELDEDLEPVEVEVDLEQVAEIAF